MCLGIPGEVIALNDRDGLPYGSVRFGGVMREVCFACQPDVQPGDFVLVHVGLAIAKVDRAQAEAAWRVLEQIGQTAELAEEKQGETEEQRQENSSDPETQRSSVPPFLPVDFSGREPSS